MKYLPHLCEWVRHIARKIYELAKLEFQSELAELPKYTKLLMFSAVYLYTCTALSMRILRFAIAILQFWTSN